MTFKTYANMTAEEVFPDDFKYDPEFLVNLGMTHDEYLKMNRDIYPALQQIYIAQEKTFPKGPKFKNVNPQRFFLMLEAASSFAGYDELDGKLSEWCDATGFDHTLCDDEGLIPRKYFKKFVKEMGIPIFFECEYFKSFTDLIADPAAKKAVVSFLMKYMPDMLE